MWFQLSVPTLEFYSEEIVMICQLTYLYLILYNLANYKPVLHLLWHPLMLSHKINEILLRSETFTDMIRILNITYCGPLKTNLMLRNPVGFYDEYRLWEICKSFSHFPQTEWLLNTCMSGAGIYWPLNVNLTQSKVKIEQKSTKWQLTGKLHELFKAT
jgi:hypothetical protein